MSLEHLITTYGYWALFAGTFLEGETVLVLAGFAARGGLLDLPWVMGVAFAGSLLGDQTFFCLGRWQGKRFLARRPSWQPRIARADRLLARHQGWILLGFRFLYGLRAVIPFVIGAGSISTVRFVLLNTVGAILWSVLIALLGYSFGAAMEALISDVKRYELLGLLIIAVAGAAVWLFRHLGKRRLPPGDGPPAVAP